MLGVTDRTTSYTLLILSIPDSGANTQLVQQGLKRVSFPNLFVIVGSIMAGNLKEPSWL